MRHGRTSFVIGLVILIGLLMAWRQLSASPRLFVAEVTGEASLARVGLDQPVRARQGSALQAADHVTTGTGAEAVLQFGPSTQIRVGPTSSVEVASIDDEGLSLELDEGTVRAIVRPDSGQVRIGNQGRSAVTRDGEVAVGVRDDVLQIRAVDGNVALEGVDRERLAEGEQAVVEGRRAKVDKVPASLLLSVAPPGVTRTTAETHLVRGQTAPGAEVVLRGPADTQRVRADAEGRFVAPVRLVEGENAVTVEVRDVFGAAGSTEAPLPARDTTAPVLRGDVEYPR